MIEVVYGIYVYALTNVARGSVRVRRTVVGPYRVRVRVRVSISYCLTYVKTCSEYLIWRTALYYFNRLGSGEGQSPSPVQNNTYITLIVMVSVIIFARWRLRMSSMLLLPIRM